MKPEDIYIYRYIYGKKNIFNQDLTKILCKKREKAVINKQRNGGFFTQTQISIISNLCCEKQALIHIQFSYIDLFFKYYCSHHIMLYCVIGVSINLNIIIFWWNHHNLISEFWFFFWFIFETEEKLFFMCFFFLPLFDFECTVTLPALVWG